VTAARAISWNVTDGIAVVTLDCPGAPVNTISRDVMAEFNATFEALARDQSIRAVAFFSGKAENFIAGANIEEFVRLSNAAEAERMSAEGQEMLMRVARLPRPVVVGIHALPRRQRSSQDADRPAGDPAGHPAGRGRLPAAAAARGPARRARHDPRR
jgi:enoyl-CoA hydratase/carnithine racemase